MDIKEYIEILKEDIEVFERLVVKKQINDELSLDMSEEEWREKVSMIFIKKLLRKFNL